MLSLHLQITNKHYLILKNSLPIEKHYSKIKFYKE